MDLCLPSFVLTHFGSPFTLSSHLWVWMEVISSLMSQLPSGCIVVQWQMITAYLTIDLKPPLSFMLLPCTSQLKQNLLPRFVLLGRCPWQEGWAPEKIFVMQACIAAFSLQFALPLQTYFPTHSGNRKKTHQIFFAQIPTSPKLQIQEPQPVPCSEFQWIQSISEII